MSVLKDARQKAGYDVEELWFHQKDRELIAKMRQRENGLKVIQGGKSGKGKDSEDKPPAHHEERQRKKAA